MMLVTHTRAEITRARLRSAALDLFEQRGYKEVTVAAIAAAAGVSHMTFFRHFASKERVLLDDPFDPVIAQAAAAQDASLPPVTRMARGFLSLLPLIEAAFTPQMRRALAIAATNPELASGVMSNNAATEQAMVDALAADHDAATVRMAASALLASINTALFTWAGASSDGGVAHALASAVHAVVPSLEGVHVPPFAVDPAILAGLAAQAATEGNAS